MLLTRWNPDHITLPDLFNRIAPALHPARTRRDDQDLAKRVRVPSRARTGLKRDKKTRCARRSNRLEQRIDSHGAGEVLRRRLPRRLRTAPHNSDRALVVGILAVCA